ncbi:hypothetical protein HELRODRAFT_164892 [Helobdella robusta]|uniref:Uncharacterized protein n=1 Tax=Helobdella robusta TaxID=6412 RepID=T1EVX6_HELRO|nr:hypothetical protein HELRODRAFT_164892 [Helobdella robusta]ESN92779.1 hypothetical protein HELRODRAFT_164892 [Helobdella robusta]
MMMGLPWHNAVEINQSQDCFHQWLLSNSTQIVQHKLKIKQAKKVIGKQTTCSSNLKPMKIELRKKMVYVGKLAQCTPKDAICHLKSIDVTAISYFYVSNYQYFLETFSFLELPFHSSKKCTLNVIFLYSTSQN